MAYVTLDQLRAYVRDEGRGLGVDVMQSALSAAEAWVGDYTQRSFAVAGASSARVYVPTGTDLLPIHDATAVTVVAEDGTTLASTAWQLEPLNGLDGSGRSVPYSAIRRIDGDVWEPSASYPGKAIISVTGTWGWSAVPDAVVQATLIVARDIVSQQDVRNGLVSFGDFAARASNNRQVTALLDPFRSSRSWGIA